MKEKEDVFMLIDIETTGLDPNVHRILEVAASVIDLKTLESSDAGYLSTAYFNFDSAPFIHEAVRHMHHENGLWEECKKSPRTEDDVLSGLAEFFRSMGGKNRNIVAVGNSVDFDLSFLKRHPSLEPLLSHRKVDIRTALYLVEYWTGLKPEKPKVEHRALSDCIGSLEVLRWCKAQLSSHTY